MKTAPRRLPEVRHTFWLFHGGDARSRDLYSRWTERLVYRPNTISYWNQLLMELTLFCYCKGASKLFPLSRGPSRLLAQDRDPVPVSYRLPWSRQALVDAVFFSRYLVVYCAALPIIPCTNHVISGPMMTTLNLRHATVVQTARRDRMS